MTDGPAGSAPNLDRKHSLTATPKPDPEPTHREQGVVHIGGIERWFG